MSIAPASVASTAAGPRLLPDVGGPIRELAVQFKYEWLADDARRIGYEQLLKTFAPNMQIVLLTEAGTKDAIAAWTGKLGIRHAVCIVGVSDPGFTQASAWMRDGFLCAYDGAQRRYFDVADGMTGYHAQWLAAADHAPVDAKPVVVEGGDCLVGEDVWLVSADAVHKTLGMANQHYTVETATKAIAALDPRRLVLVGYRVADLPDKRAWFRSALRGQARRWIAAKPRTKLRRWAAVAVAPFVALGRTLRMLFNPAELIMEFGHLDLVVSLTGERRDGKELLLVADARPSGGGLDKICEAWAARLDALARRLSAVEGFAVMRCPTPFFKGVTVAHFTNVLLQTDPKVVWLPQLAMPQNGLAQAEAENIRLWSSLGFQVKQIGGWGGWADDRGAIRCATKPLRR